MMTGATHARSDARMVHVRLTPEVHRRLRIIVAAEDTSIQEWLSRVVKDAVEGSWSRLSTSESRT